MLRSIPFFQRLPEDGLEYLAAAGREERRAADDIVCAEGDTSRSMYAVLEGTVRIYKMDADGEELELNRLGSGSYFGELALLDGAPRTASVQCVTACRLYVLEGQAFLDTIEAHPKILSSVVFALTSRMRDRIEEEFHREQTLRTIRTEAEIARHRSLAQMVAGVAHELNTPIAVAATAGGMIAKRMAAPELAAALDADRTTRTIREDIVEATDLLQRNLGRAHTLVESFKKIAVNQLTEAVEQVDLPDTVKEIVYLFSINARRAQLSISIRNLLPEGSDRRWTGHVGYLTQILMNLLTNIERYAYPDGKGGPVEVSIEGGAMGARPAFIVAVSDFGAGIESTNLARVFEPFFTTGRIKGGTGLGMAIVHNLVTDAIGGKIGIDSTVSQGTTVRMALPVTPEQKA
ncbi:MAG: cyclic nucleotide-binding domain-containing protein [Bryobacteraceae bacterium]